MLLIRWAVLAFSMWIATLVVPGITVDGGITTYLWVALLFGLINSEGNHGEDIKELHWSLDGTPTSSYNRMLYKYPQGAFPYERLLRTNASLPRTAPEFEILDTGLFDDNRYFDCEIIWAKASPTDHLLKVIVHNRGDEPATLHVLPQAICTNTSSNAGLPSKGDFSRLALRSVPMTERVNTNICAALGDCNAG